MELALCYYKTNEEKEALGWMYLKDVDEISEGPRGKDAGYSLTIHSVARTMTVQAMTDEDYMLWLQSLIDHCPHAALDNVKSKITKHGFLMICCLVVFNCHDLI